MPTLIDDLLQRAREAIDGNHEPILFGHSFGAIVAFELARAFAIEGLRPALVVSGSRIPGLGLDRIISHLSDIHFVAAVRDIVGFTHPAMDEPELLELILPALRADMRLNESYRLPNVAPMAVPILALRGSADQVVSAADTAQWRRFTTESFAVSEFRGDHMYIVDEFAAMMRVIEEHFVVKETSDESSIQTGHAADPGVAA